MVDATEEVIQKMTISAKLNYVLLFHSLKKCHTVGYRDQWNVLCYKMSWIMVE